MVVQTFGFTSGANYDKKHDIQPDLTSYDYDAPISEAGWVTPKFDSIRKAISEYAKYKIPEAPKPIPVKALPEIKLEQAYNLLEYAEASKAITSETPNDFLRTWVRAMVMCFIQGISISLSVVHWTCLA